MAGDFITTYSVRPKCPGLFNVAWMVWKLGSVLLVLMVAHVDLQPAVSMDGSWDALKVERLVV